MIRRRRRKDHKAIIKYLLRDPLDQYSDWPCNKCDFSLEVTISYSSNDQNLNLAHAVNIRCPTWRERSTRWRRSSTISPASKRIQSKSSNLWGFTDFPQERPEEARVLCQGAPGGRSASQPLPSSHCQVW